jgi:uncharacterized protein YceK
LKFVIGGLACILMSGCSSLSNNVDTEPRDLYKIVAVANTDVDENGDTCADAIGIIRVIHNKIVGSARDTFGRSYKVSGSIDENNNVTGGFAITMITAVDYEGSMSMDGKKAKGKWSDLYNCSGTWASQKLNTKT